MIDASDRLLAERFAALPSPPDDSDWLDVRRRAGVERGRVWLALPLAAVVAVVAAGSALALYRDSIDFWSAPAAPERIVVDFHRTRIYNSLGLGPEVIPGEARKITEFTIDDEPRGLFVAPTTDGSYCWRLHYIGQCRMAGDDAVLGLGWRRSATGGGAAWINGDVRTPNVAGIEIEYEDGTSTRVPFVWVTDPIDAGFFSFDVPPAHLVIGHRPTIVSAVDDDGAELARHELPFDDSRWETEPDGLPRVADRTQKRTLFELEDHKGNPWTLVVAPAPEEKLCWAYNFGSGCFSPRFPATPDALSLNGGAVVRVCCAVGEGVATVELRFEDRTRTELKPVEGFLLHLIPPEHYAVGHRLREIVMRDAAGNEVATRLLETDTRAVYPCAKEDELDLGHGVRVCP